MPPTFLLLASRFVIMPLDVESINLPKFLDGKYLVSNFSISDIETEYLGFTTPTLFMTAASLTFISPPRLFSSTLIR